MKENENLNANETLREKTMGESKSVDMGING